MSQNYDIVIIGGGIIGNSVASHLANENLKVAVINSTTLGMPASIAAAGLFQLQTGELQTPLLKEFCFKSFNYFPEFYEKIKSTESIKNIDLGFKQTGSFFLVFSNYEIAHKENELREIKTIMPNASFLSKADISRHEPLLSNDVIGAYHYPLEGYINNPKFLKALSIYCTERKIDYINSEVNEIKINNKKIENISLGNGETITAEKYVLCNGVWANKILKDAFNLNEDLIKGIKGEILQIGVPEKMPIQKVIFCHEGYILPRPATNEFETPSILIGGTTEEISLKNNDVFKNTVSGISTLINLFQKLLPSCKNYPVSRMWTGLRPNTPDNLPIISKVPEVNNLILGLGHYKNGILMGPLTGKLIKDLLSDRTTGISLEPYNITRFITDSQKNKQNKDLIVNH